MKLAEISPQFLRASVDGARLHVDTLADAQGIRFRCPCGAGHALVVWFDGRGVPADEIPTPRWQVSGSGYADLTLSPSLDAGCWHGFVRSGDVLTC